MHGATPVSRAWVVKPQQLQRNPHLRRAAVLVSLVASLGGVGAWLVRRQSPEPRAAAIETVPSAPDQEIAQQLQELRAEVTALRAIAPGPSVTPAGPASPAAIDPRATPEPPDDVMRKARLREDEIRSAFDSRLATEGRDSLWSDKTEAQIGTVLSSGIVSGATLVTVRCGTSVCRALVGHKDVEGQRSLASAVARTSPFSD